MYGGYILSKLICLKIVLFFLEMHNSVNIFRYYVSIYNVKYNRIKTEIAWDSKLQCEFSSTFLKV